MSNGIPEHFVDLPVTGSSFSPKFSKDCIPDFFTRRSMDSSASAYRKCKEKTALLWSHTLQATFFVWIPTFISWFHHRVALVPLFTTAHTESFPFTYPSSRWSYSCRCTSTVRFGFSQNNDTLSSKVFLTALFIRVPRFIWYDLLVLHVCVGPGGFSKCRLKTSKWWSVDSSAHLLTRTSNTERNKSAETMKFEWLLTQRIPVPGVLVHICVGQKCSWCTLYCYSTAAGGFRCHLGSITV